MKKYLKSSIEIVFYSDKDIICNSGNHNDVVDDVIVSDFFTD